MERNGTGWELFDLMLRLTLLEWSVREFRVDGAHGEMDEIWRKRFRYYVMNSDSFILRGR